MQALPPSASPLAQLPDLEVEKAFEMGAMSGAEGMRWAEKALKKGILSGTAKEVIDHWPRLELTDAAFRGQLRKMR